MSSKALLKVDIDGYRRATITMPSSLEWEEGISWLQEWPGLSEECALIIFKGLTGGEHFSRMDQKQAIAINRIFVKQREC